MGYDMVLMICLCYIEYYFVSKYFDVIEVGAMRILYFECS